MTFAISKQISIMAIAVLSATIAVSLIGCADDSSGSDDGDTDTDTDTNSDTDTDTDADTDADSGADSGPDTDTDADTDGDSDTSIDAGTDADTDTDTDADADTDAGVGSDDGCTASGNWYDEATSLCWQNPPDTSESSGEFPGTLCSWLDSGGFYDWRLPTIQELISLVRGCVAGTATGDLSPSDCGVTDPDCLDAECEDASCDSCEILAGPDGDPDGCYWDPDLGGDCWWYWSSSVVASDTDYVWVVGFSSGAVTSHLVWGGGFIRCVR